MARWFNLLEWRFLTHDNNTVRQDHLATLGLDSDADLTAIKMAFRRLASIYHPDKNSSQRQRFIKICRAYDQLMTPINKVPTKVNTQNRRQGKRGEPTQRRFEILLETEYKGVNIRTQA